MGFLKRLLGLGGKDKENDKDSFDCAKCGESFETEAELKIHKHKHKQEDAGGSRQSDDGGDRLDYDEIVSGTIKEVKEEVKGKDIDYKKLLKAEKKNKDRKTLKSWIENQME